MSSDGRAARAAWVDEDDVADAQRADALPAFMRQAHTTPAWAASAATSSLSRKRQSDVVAATTRDAHGANDSDDDDTAHERKRRAARQRSGHSARAANAAATETAATTAMTAEGRTATATMLRGEPVHRDDVEALLSRTEALIARDAYGAGGGGRRTPTVLSVLPLPRDAARTMHWLRHGQLAIVGGNRHVYTFHAAGRFVEQLSKVDVRQRVETTVLCAGEEALVVAGHEAYTPQLLTLATEQLTPLTFLDTRSSAVYHGNARGMGGKTATYISHMATPPPPSSSSSVVAVAHGRSVTLGSLTSGSILTRVAVDDDVSAVHFTTPTQLLVAAGCTLRVYDVRKTAAHLLRRVVDTAAVHISAVAVSASTLAVGTSSGVVHVYANHTYDKPTRVLKNLTTCIHHIGLASSHTGGDGGDGGDVLAFASRSEKAAFRLVRLPEGGVLPSFPAVAMRHSFVQSLTLSQTLPILSVGERQKVTNYAL